MEKRILVKRYATGLVNALRDEAEFSAVRDEIESFARLVESHAGLQSVLSSPFVNIASKKDIVGEILEKQGYGEKASRFVKLLVENKRQDLLPDILRSMSDLWNAKQGVLVFEVSSAVALSDRQKQRLKSELEKREKNPVSLTYRIDSGLIGGLALRRGHIIYDVSVKGDLRRLKEILSEG
ncbi:MAG TPA: ATP synthase F1 subunit delta [Candidatus Aminicenantes bacterium]|nr:ATP synthase F1 subunit delta [Candidatus Aminicenantes bacterium]